MFGLHTLYEFARRPFARVMPLRNATTHGGFERDVKLAAGFADNRSIANRDEDVADQLAA